MSGTGELVVARPAHGVVVLELHRPRRRNALTLALMAALAATLDALAADGETRCVVLTGAPPAFCAGGDLAELRDGDARHYAAYCASYRTIARAVRGLGCPLVAAINGPAVAGGLELACLADLRLVAEDAFLAGGDARLGLPTTSGLSWLLPRLVGVGQARRILFTDVRVGAREALALGLAEEVHAADALVARAVELAAEIAAMPGSGIARTRRLIDDGLTSTHEQAMAAELDEQAAAYGDPAVQEAFAAFFTR